MNHPFIKYPPKSKAFQNFWPQFKGGPAVFLAEYVVPASHPANPTGKIMSAALFSGNGPSPWPKYPGPALHYKVVELPSLREHDLSQGGESTAYQNKEEQQREARLAKKKVNPSWMGTPEMDKWIQFGGDVMVAMERLTGADNPPASWEADLMAKYEQAGSPKARGRWLADQLRSRFSWLAQRPRWVEDAKEWCYIGDKPMIFLGQVYTPDDKKMPEGAPVGDMTYLFFDQTDTGLQFKVMNYRCGEQTAENHYLLEEQIARFNESGGSVEDANGMAKKGDRWAHRFLLDQSALEPKTLELLVKHGANRELKDEAKARLKEMK